jgi:hypothetical protein
MKFSRFFALIFSVLHVMIWVNTCKAQISNELAFDQLISDFVTQKGSDVDTLAGFVTEGLKGKIVLNPRFDRALLIEEPNIEFKKMRDRKFLRSISTVVSYKDSIEISFPIQYQDTIFAKDLRAIRKSSHLELRGSNPRWTSKYLLPIALIGTGIAVIISLFYLRS